MVKEIALYKGKLSKFVHVAVESALKRRLAPLTSSAKIGASIILNNVFNF